MLRVALDPIGNMKYQRRTQNEWPATRRIPVSRQRAGKILLRRAGSCWDQAALTGARRPTQCIGRPRLSWRGSVPKVATNVIAPRTNIIDGSRRIAVTDSKVACLRVIMDSATRIQYSPISLLRKSVRGNMVPSKRIRDSGGLFDPCVLGD
jgi:hypothetical protein